MDNYLTLNVVKQCFRPSINRGREESETKKEWLGRVFSNGKDIILTNLARICYLFSKRVWISNHYINAKLKTDVESLKNEIQKLKTTKESDLSGVKEKIEKTLFISAYLFKNTSDGLFGKKAYEDGSSGFLAASQLLLDAEKAQAANNTQNSGRAELSTSDENSSGEWTPQTCCLPTAEEVAALD